MFLLIWILALVAGAAWAGVWWVATHPDIVGRGQDPAGRGMAVGCLAVQFAALGTLAAIIAGICTLVRFDSLNLATRIIGLAPTAIIAAGFLIAWGISRHQHAVYLRNQRALDLAGPEPKRPS